MQTQKEEINFETALSELETIVRTLESGKGELDDSIKNYEKGTSLVKICEEKLKSAKLKVELITNKDATNPETKDFNG
jgi:exodeoxyribonuclease VII small subunit